MTSARWPRSAQPTKPRQRVVARIFGVAGRLAGAMFAISISVSVPATAQLVIDGSNSLHLDKSDSIHQDIFVYDDGYINVEAARPFPSAEFFDRSLLVVRAADGITDGMIVSFADHSSIVLFAPNAISGGDVALAGNAKLRLFAANAITGGEITLSGTAVLDVDLPFAITGGKVTARDNSRINVTATNAFTRGVDLNVFDNAVLDIRGHTLTVGSLNATGTITNSSSNASTLIIDGTQSANSISHIWGPISNGAGGMSLVKKGRGEVVLHDWQPFTGHTTVSGGRLSLDNARTDAAITITNGATLSMTSSQAGITVVETGGTLVMNALKRVYEPDIRFSGDLTFQRGSVLDVRFKPAPVPVSFVDGIANLSGVTVRIGYPSSFPFKPSEKFPILTAGEIRGRPAKVVDELAFLDAYGETTTTTFSVTLFRNDFSFLQVGETPNQDAVAASAEALRAGHAVHDAIVGQNEAGALAAFDVLSGESHAAAATASIEDSRFVRNAAMDRVRIAFDGSGQEQAFSTQFAGWGQAFGSWGDSDGRYGVELLRTTGGVLTGVDGLLLDTWRVGAMTGYSRSDFSVKERAASGTSDNVHFASMAARNGPQSASGAAQLMRGTI